MGLIWTEGARTQQPSSAARIDWANPISRGLKIALLPHWGSGNLAKGNAGSYAAQVDRKVVNGNLALDWISGAGNRSFDSGHSDNAVTAVSMVALINNPNISGGNLGCLFGFRGGGNGGIVVYGSSTGTAPSQQARIQVTHGGVAALGASGYSAAGAVNTRWLPVGFTDVAGSTCRYFLDGNFDSSVASASISQTAFEHQVARDTMDGANAICNMAVFFWWSRALSDAEMVSVQANPWQLFEADNDPVFYGISSSGTTVAVPAGALTLTGYAPTIAATAHQTIAVPKGALVLSAFAPTVSTSAAQTISVPLASLTLTGFAPTVAATAHQTISVPAASLTLTAYAPTVYTTLVTTVSVPAAAITLTGYAPTVSYTANQSISVPKGALSLTGYAPTVIGGTSSIWTQVSASGGTWTPASLAPGTWTPQ